METCGCVLMMIAIVISHFGGTNAERCPSPQYLELGKTQEIQCLFQDGFYAVAWYASNDFRESKSLIRLVDGLKEGNGYTTREFDIQVDGSLIINNVTLQHDHIFTVLKFQSQDDNPVILVVEAIVTVKPIVNFPVIDLCEGKSSCFTQLSPGSNVTCFVRGARPAVSLTWVGRIDGGDRNVSLDTSVTDNNSTFTSRATTSSAFSYSSLLSLLVCKADTSAGILLQHESLIFVENSQIDLSNVSTVTIYVERDSPLQLPCSETNASLIVWKMTKEMNGVFHMIGYAAYFGTNISNIYLEDYVLQSDGSLKLSQAETKHEGLYGCVHENKDARGTVVYKVVVFVASSPVVHGCTLNQYCVLATQYEGNLTCSVTGIRPNVHLEWKTLDDRDASLIMFTDQTTTISTNGETYDVQITSKYKIQQTSRNRLTLECKILGPSITAFSSTAKFDLLVSNVQLPTSQPTKTKPTDDFVATGHKTMWIIGVIVVILLTLLLILNIIHLLKGRRRKGKRLKKERLPEHYDFIGLL